MNGDISNNWIKLKLNNYLLVLSENGTDIGSKETNLINSNFNLIKFTTLKSELQFFNSRFTQKLNY